MLARTPKTALYLAKPKPAPRKINKDRRRHLVETVARVMREGRDAGTFPTLLNLEGPLRHGLRARLCLRGWSWTDADAMAAEIVAAALNRIGARRPTWAEGQPEYSQNGAGALIERTRCVRCGSTLQGESTKFCGPVCSNAHHTALVRLRQAEEHAAYDYVAKGARWLALPCD